MLQDVETQAEKNPQQVALTEEILLSLNQIVWAIALPTYEVIHISPSIESVCGCSARQLMNKPRLWLTVLHREDRSHVLHWFNTLPKATPSEHQFRIIAADGSIHWIHCHAVLVQSDINPNQTSPLRRSASCSVQGIARLIPPLPRGVMLSADSGSTRPASVHPEPTRTPETSSPRIQLSYEQDFRAIFEQAGLGIAHVDCSGRYLRVNQRFCDMLGYSEAELLQRSFRDITHRDDLHKDCHKHSALFDGRLSHFTHEKRYVHKDGRCLWVNLSASLLRDHQGTVVGDIAIIEDISDRKRSEDELRRSQHMLRLIIDNIPQRIFWKDKNLRYLGCNLSQAKASGLQAPSEIVGKTDNDLPWTTEQADYYRRWDQRVMAQNVAEFAIPETQRQSDGQLVWLEANKIPLHDAEGNVIGILGTVEDVTTRRQAERALQQQLHREKVLNHVIQAIRDSLDVPTIFQTAKQHITDLFGAQRVCILRYLSRENLWQVTTECPDHDIISDGFSIALNHRGGFGIDHVRQGHIIVLPYEQVCGCVHGSMAATTTGRPPCTVPTTDERMASHSSVEEPLLDEPLDAEDADESADESLDADESLPSGQCIFIPLLVSHDTETLFRQDEQPNATAHHLWGCLCIITATSDDVLDEVEQELARVIANQLAIAIQQSELYQRIQSFNQELERTVQQRTNELQHALVVEAMLKRIIDNVRNSLDEHHILHAVVKELAETLVLDCCNTGMYDHDAGLVHIQQEHMTIEMRSVQGQVESFGDRPEIYRQLLSGIAFQYSQLYIEEFRPDYTPTILCFPIIISEHVVGDLWLYRPRYATFCATEVSAVEQIVSQCAIAIRQARLYQAAQAQVHELERLNRMKDDFLSTVSHELRTPIANIKMAAQMLEITMEQCKENPNDQVCTYLKILQDEAQQEMELINDLLDLQHLSAGTRPLEPVNLDLREWIPHIAESFQVRATEHDQAIAIQIDDDLPCIYSDLVSLQRIVSELLNNACKYTPPSETITLTAWSPQRDVVAIAVSNTGVEIAPTELSRIFDKFYRIPQSDRWKHGGTGLGLALVRELTHHLDGTITATSENNTTCFTIQLPLYAQGRS